MFWKLFKTELLIRKHINQCSIEIDGVVNCGVDRVVIYNYAYARIALHAIQTTLTKTFTCEDHYDGIVERSLVRTCNEYRKTISNFENTVARAKCK
jgi:hypothetical protein